MGGVTSMPTACWSCDINIIAASLYFGISALIVRDCYGVLSHRHRRLGNADGVMSDVDLFDRTVIVRYHEPESAYTELLTDNKIGLSCSRHDFPLRWEAIPVHRQGYSAFRSHFSPKAIAL